MSVKHYAPKYMLSLKHALTVIIKHQKWLSSKVEESDLTIMQKPHAHLLTMTKGPAKFQKSRKKENNSARRTPTEKNMGPLILHADVMYKISGC